MSITAVTAGTRSMTAGSNPSATPALPSGVGEGDQLVIVDLIRANANTAPNAPSTPSGWTVKNTFTATGSSRALRLSYLYRPWVSGVTAPTLTLTASSSTAHYAIMLRVPGALQAGDPTEYLGANGSPATSSTQMGPFAGGTTTNADCAVIVAGVRENDVTDGSTISAPTHSGLTFSMLDSMGTLSSDDYVFAVAYALVPSAMTIGDLSFGISHDTAYKSIGQQWAIAPEPTANPASFFPILAAL